MTKEQILEEENNMADEMLTEWVTVGRAAALRAMERHANQRSADLQASIFHFRGLLHNMSAADGAEEVYEKILFKYDNVFGITTVKHGKI